MSNGRLSPASASGTAMSDSPMTKRSTRVLSATCGSSRIKTNAKIIALPIKCSALPNKGAIVVKYMRNELATLIVE